MNGEPPVSTDAGTAPERRWCEFLNWQVFENGTHRGTYYPPDAVRRLCENFERLRGHLVPIMSLGHDREARVTESLGLPNVGKVVGVRSPDNRDVFIDVTNVPAWLGAMANAERYRGGSVELKPFFPDPSDPGRQIAGPIMDVVSLLGEEQPAIRGMPPPKATYPDGTEVEPNWDPLAIPTEMLAALSKSSTGGREPALCFSEAFAMTPEQMKAALADLLPAGVLAKLDEAALKEAYDAMLGGESAEFSDKMKKRYSDTAATSPNPPADPQALSDCVKKLSDQVADMTKRLGDVEAAKAADQKAGDEAKVAAFSDRVNRVLDANRKRFAPGLRPALFQAGLSTLTTKTYGSVSGDPEKAFAAWQAGIEVMPESKMFSDTIDDRKPAAGVDLSENGKAALKRLNVEYPNVAKRLLATAAN